MTLTQRGIIKSINLVNLKINYTLIASLGLNLCLNGFNPIFFNNNLQSIPENKVVNIIHFFYSIKTKSVSKPYAFSIFNIS
jgi:hypothetical protein